MIRVITDPDPDPDRLKGKHPLCRDPRSLIPVVQYSTVGLTKAL